MALFCNVLWSAGLKCRYSKSIHILSLYLHQINVSSLVHLKHEKNQNHALLTSQALTLLYRSVFADSVALNGPKKMKLEMKLEDHELPVERLSLLLKEHIVICVDQGLSIS
jgi:hypothetical protein